MQIMWFSANSSTDMCFTSQKALINGLASNGYDVQLINQDSLNTNMGINCQHFTIGFSNFPGMKSASLAKNMARWLNQQESTDGCIAIVDWRLIAKLHRVLTMKKIPWILLDRSPPADKGVLAKLQWPVWRKAWKLVAKSTSAKGTVVSAKHQQYVQNRINIVSNKICQLPAGVNLEVFEPRANSGKLKLIYHGRLDRHRGVLALPMLLRKGISAGLDISMKLIGDGDCFDELQKIALMMDQLAVYPRMPVAQVANHLRESTIGLLPMPDIDMWAISSPLKRSEYCASGLLIFGIDHDGHRFDSSDYPWLKLVPQHDFHEEGIRWFSELSDSNISEFAKYSREFAEEYLSWDITLNLLIQSIQSISER